jgi:hypothetical protein
MRRSAFVLSLVAALTAAVPARADAGPCPPAGTVAVRDDGARWVFVGQDAEEPGICVVRIGQETRRLLYGIWTPIGPDMEAARTAFARLFAGGPGTTVAIREHVMTDAWLEEWTWVGEETVALASGPRRAVRLERRMRLTGPTAFTAQVSYLVDAETGVVLRAKHRHIDGLRLPYRDLVITRLDPRG